MVQMPKALLSHLLLLKLHNCLHSKEQMTHGNYTLEANMCNLIVKNMPWLTQLLMQLCVL